MLRSAKGLVGCVIGAADGDIGRVETLYFDDDGWTVRYFVVDTGEWLSRRRVLVSPVCVRRPDWTARRLPTALTRTQIQASPSLDARPPLSRQLESAFCHYYGIPAYWPTSAAAVDPRLRSSAEIRGHVVHATDGTLGHVDDLLVEDLTWRIRYLKVDTGRWWPGQGVLVAPEWMDRMSGGDSAVVVAVSRDAVQRAPEYDASRPLDRAYEQRLYDFYGHSGYWEEPAAA